MFSQRYLVHPSAWKGILHRAAVVAMIVGFIVVSIGCEIAQQIPPRPLAVNKNRRLLSRVVVSFACAVLAAFLAVSAGSAGHCGSDNAECTIYPVNFVGFPTADSIWILYALVAVILAFTIIGWWRKYSNSPS